jgi:predicted DNA-binding protein
MKEQTTIRLPSEMKEEIQREAEEKRITIRMEPRLYNELNTISVQTGLTISALLKIAIWKRVLMP